MTDTTLAKAQSATDDLAYAAAAGPRARGFLIKIDNEYELVEWRGDQFARPWQVERGVLGTTPAAHSQGATVSVDPSIGGGSQTLAQVLVVGHETGPTLPILVTGTNQAAHTIEAATGAQLGPAFLIVGVEPGDGSGGQAVLQAADGVTGFNGGNAILSGGGGNGGGGPQATGGVFTALGGLGDGTPGDLELFGGGVGTGTGMRGGDIKLLPTQGDGAGRNGQVIVTIPTADPHVVGALYSTAGTVKVSAG
jgi:hypothetical protein